MFGRRRHMDEEAAREAERRALFEELAKRPDTVCPFLGLASARAEFRPEPNGEHRCYAFGDPAPLADEQQRHVCLERGYSNCPRYLRGVLVIPTEELEALRRPQPHVPPPPPPRPVQERRSRRGLLVIPLILLLLAGIGAGSWYLINRNNGIAVLPSESPSPTPQATVSASVRPSASALATATPRTTPTPEPTPTIGDKFAFYEVGVGPTSYTVFRVDPSSGPGTTLRTGFADYSRAPVKPLRTNDGLVYWETTQGALTGWSYIPGRSGSFQLREVFLTPQGARRVIVMPAAQATILPTATPAPRS